MEPQTNPPAPRAESASNNRRPSTRRYVKRVAPQSSTTTNNTAAPNSEQSQPSHIRKNNRRGNRTRTGNNSETERAPRTKRGNSVKNDREIEDLKSIPPLAPGDIRIVPVCGVEWITTNMTFVEYMDEIIVIDAGLGFSNPSTPGIDYTIPNTTYLKANQHKIKALVITHGHLDHVGAIPFVIKDLGNPPIYTREFGALFIKKKLEEFPQLPPVNIQTIDEHTGYTKLSENFKVKFFGLTHSIPDSSGVILQTPLGGIVSTGDVRVENENGVINKKEIAQYAHFKDEKILLLTMDSTGIEKPGWTISERIVIENVDKIVKETTGGRLFIAAFSSQVERLMSFMESAQKHGKYIALEGRSMKSNLGIAEFLNLTDFKHVIPIEKIVPCPTQPRQVFDAQSLEQLSMTMKEMGQAQAITVRPAGDKYEIISGERRYRAAKLAGLPHLHCLVKEVDNKDARLLSLVENLQRDDLLPIEEAHFLKRVLQDHGDLNLDKLARMLGSHKSTLSEKIQLTEVPEPIQKMLYNKDCHFTHRHG